MAYVIKDGIKYEIPSSCYREGRENTVWFIEEPIDYSAHYNIKKAGEDEVDNCTKDDGVMANSTKDDDSSKRFLYFKDICEKEDLSLSQRCQMKKRMYEFRRSSRTRKRQQEYNEQENESLKMTNSN